MSKKVVENVPEKKKKNRCCSCLVGCGVTVLVLVVLVLGAGFFVGDYFSKKYLDMKATEVLSAARSLYGASEKKIVKNGYTEADLDAFYNEFKRQLFLKEDVQLDADTVIDMMGGAENAEGTVLAAALRAAAGENGETPPAGDGTGETPAPEGGTGETPAPDEGTGGAGTNDKLMNFFESVFTRDNMDLTRLASYDESKHEEFLLTIRDKELAAFVNDLFVSLLSSGDALGGLGDSLAGMGVSDLSKVAGLDQIIFTRGEREVAVTEGETTVMQTKQVTTAKVTLHVLPETIAKQAVASVSGLSSFKWAINPLINVFLPKNIFLSAEIGLTDNVGADLRINSMSDKQQQNAYKLIGGITAMTGERLDVEQKLTEVIEAKVQPQLDTFSKFVDFAAIEGGAVAVDPFESVIEVSGLNKDKEEAAKISSDDILVTLQGLLTSEMKGALKEEADYKNYIVDADGGIIYDPANVNDANRADFKNEFMKEMRSKYMLADTVTYDDVVSLFGIGTTESTAALTDYFDPEKLSAALKTDIADLYVNINDRMLGAIIDSQIVTMLGENADLTRYNPSVEQVMIEKRLVGEVDHSFVGVSLSVETASLLTGDNAMIKIVGNLLPEKIMLTLRVDITPGLGEADYLPTEITYNDFNKTDRIFDTVDKLGAGGFNKDEILSQVVAPVREMIAKMIGVLPGLSFETSKIVMPDLFDTMAEMLFKDEAGLKVVSGAEIQQVLKKIDEPGKGGVDADGNPLPNEQFESGYITDGNGAASNYDGFMTAVEKDYYVKMGEGETRVKTFTELFDRLSVGAAFNADNFNLTGNGGLLYDNRPASELCPVFNDEEIAALFIENMHKQGNATAFDGMTDVLELKISVMEGVPSITLKIRVNVSKLLSAENRKLVNVDYLYLTSVTTVDEARLGYYKFNEAGCPDVATDDPNFDAMLAAGELRAYYPTELTVNNMTAEEFGWLKTMIAHLEKGSGDVLDFDARTKDLGYLVHDQLETMRGSLNKEGEAEGFTFIDGGIKLMSFYDFLGRALNVSSDPETVKAAIQGLYPGAGAAGVTEYSGYNYDTGDFLLNPADNAASLNPAAITDRQMGYALGQTLTADGVKVSQVSILTPGSTKAAATAGWLKTFGSAYDDAANYLLVTFDMPLEKFGSIDATSEAAKFLPADLYVSVLFKCEVTGNDIAYTAEWYRVNNLTQSQQDALIQVCKLTDNDPLHDPDKLGKVVTTVTGALSAYSHGSFRETTAAEAGIGAFIPGI